MSKLQNYPPRGWQAVRLGDVATIVMGQSPPGTTYNEQGQGLPFYQGKADFGDVSPTPRVWCSAPKKTAEPGDILLSVRAPVGPTNLASHRCCIGRGLAAIRGGRNALTPYLYFWFNRIEPWLSEQGEGSTFKAIGKDILENIVVPLPPLPVQERIVEILQKADEIRQKRKQALELANKILPAIFYDSFDRPGREWLAMPLGEIVFARSGGTPTRKKTDYWSGDIPWASPSDMKVTEIYDTQEHITEKAVSESVTHLVEPGAVLVVVRSGILAHTFPVAIARVKMAFNQDIRALIPKRDLLIPEYLLWALKARAPHVLMSIVKHGSTVHSIDSNRFFEMPIPVPPLPVQKSFVNQVEQLMQAFQGLVICKVDSEHLFDSLLSRAFTGELTAEWEAANAKWIAEQQALYERLPRLLILALIAEKAKRARRSAELLLTTLMKYLFLVQMEGSSTRRRFYHFVPYHYGPFAKELYDDLKKLQDEGLVRVESNPEEEKIKITLADPARIDGELARLPDDLKQDVTAIIEAYGDLDHNDLLKTVYEKYPAYARKSKLKRTRRNQ